MRLWLPLFAAGCSGRGCAADDAGTKVLHRLNRAEYDNTVRDLLGTTLAPAVDFPVDDAVGGFDNIAANLTVSAFHVELYALAAEDLADEVLADPALRARWVRCDPDPACVTDSVRALADQAWRRPATDAEIALLQSDVLDRVLADGGTFDDALRWGIVAVLTSPRFLYRVELDPDPASAESHPLDGYEVASRLSYFLWSSMPDAELFAAAASGELDRRAGIEAQVARMLADPKAVALVDNFGGQWLYLRGVAGANKGPIAFPEFGPTLKASMQEEMERLVASFVFEPRDLRDLLRTTEGEIDAVLADHYGVPFAGDGWQVVDLGEVHRGGILGQAGLLSVLSYPTRTSPVVRGKFVLGQLLCEEPAPPPPNVAPLEEQSGALTVREQLEAHRADPVCASCHLDMDGIGFGLEPYDAIGRWRTTDGGDPIDPTGELDGVEFTGPRALAELLADDPRYPSCVARQAFTYALGRLPTESDAPFLEAIERDFERGGYTFEALAVAITTSAPFTTRRGEP